MLERKISPEEVELQKKLAELARLENELVQAELELATVQGEIRAFEVHYLHHVGLQLAYLDELEAEIAFLNAQNHPDDPEAQDYASEARTQADESSQASGAAESEPEIPAFSPSEELKRLYRDVCKKFHPDLVMDEAERHRRTELMKEINAAYARGDSARLQELLTGEASAPEAVQGEGIMFELIRIIRKIAQVQTRIEAIRQKTTELQQSEMFQLKTRVSALEAIGQKPLDDLKLQFEHQILEAVGRWYKAKR